MHFSIPENFSRDMPAESMIESVNLNDERIYQDYQKFTLIRRWWDFREGGLLGKDLGSLMMSVYIKKTPDSLEINTTNPLDFINIIINGIERDRIDNPNPLLAFTSYNFLPMYGENWFNQQRWITYNEEQSEGGLYSFLFTIPVSTRNYVVAEFNSAPNNGIDIGDFVDNITGPFINKIMQSFQIEYQPDNPVKQAVLKSNGPTLQQLIDEKMKLLEQSPPAN